MKVEGLLKQDRNEPSVEITYAEMRMKLDANPFTYQCCKTNVDRMRVAPRGVRRMSAKNLSTTTVILV